MMNFNRGFIRLWIVVSLLWVGVALSITYQSFNDVVFGPVTPSQGAVSLPHERLACWEWHNRDNPFAFLGDDGIKNEAEARGICLDTAKNNLIAIFFPPLILLAFGFVIRWVVSGFRS